MSGLKFLLSILLKQLFFVWKMPKSESFVYGDTLKIHCNVSHSSQGPLFGRFKNIQDKTFMTIQDTLVINKLKQQSKYKDSFEIVVFVPLIT